MKILGIDPGYAIVGYGVVEYRANRFTTLDYGAILTPAHTPFGGRLCTIYEEMCRILDLHRPDCMSVEKLYFTNNKTTGIDVAQARWPSTPPCRSNRRWWATARPSRAR